MSKSVFSNNNSTNNKHWMIPNEKIQFCCFVSNIIFWTQVLHQMSSIYLISNSANASPGFCFCFVFALREFLNKYKCQDGPFLLSTIFPKLLLMSMFASQIDGAARIKIFLQLNATAGIWTQVRRVAPPWGTFLSTLYRLTIRSCDRQDDTWSVLLIANHELSLWGS